MTFCLSKRIDVSWNSDGQVIYLNADTWVSEDEPRGDLKWVPSRFRLVTVISDDTEVDDGDNNDINPGINNIDIVDNRSEYEVIHREHFLGEFAREIESQLEHSESHMLSELYKGDKPFLTKSDGEGTINVQNTTMYEITRYVKKNHWLQLILPTIQYSQSNPTYHHAYQRWYNYRDEQQLLDLDNLRVWDIVGTGSNDQVAPNRHRDVNLSVYQYKNGYVCGTLMFPSIGNNEGTNSRYSYVDRSVLFKLDNDSTDVACDFSYYTELPQGREGGQDLTEPSLSHRVVWHVKKADVIADKLAEHISSGDDNYRTEDSDTWLEDKTIHFPSVTQGFTCERLGINHELSNYWIWNNRTYHTQANLVSLSSLKDGRDSDVFGNVSEDNVRFEIVIMDEKGTGIKKSNRRNAGSTSSGSLPGLYVNVELGLGASRFVQFVYSDACDAFNYANRDAYRSALEDEAVRTVKAMGPDNPAYILVRAVADDGTKYNLARFKLIFDKNSETLSWKDVLHKGAYGYDRCAMRLKERTGHDAVARVTFDYPKIAEQTIDGFASSKLPLSFDESTYIHWYNNEGEIRSGNGEGNFHGNHRDAKFAEYSLVSLTEFWNGLRPFRGIAYKPELYPTSRASGGEDSINYVNPLLLNQPRDKENYVNGFLYVDASERAGNVAEVEFDGDFCVGDRLLVTGWITTGAISPENWGLNQAPGGVILNVKGTRWDPVLHKEVEEVLYRFCPGQVTQEMRRKLGPDGKDYFPHVVYPISRSGDFEIAAQFDKNGNRNQFTGGDWNQMTDWAHSGSYSESAPWQQFYFEFQVEKKFQKCWLEIENNCVSTSGGDYMLDNVLVYADVPRVNVDLTTPVCVVKDADGNAAYETRLLKMKSSFDAEIKVKGISPATSPETAEKYIVSFAIIEKAKFLNKFTELVKLHPGFEGYTISDVEKGLNNGEFDLDDYDDDYATAFEYAMPGDAADHEKVWDSWENVEVKNASLLRYQWSSYFEDDNIQPVFNFQQAADPETRRPVYRYQDETGRYIIFNGNIVDNVMKPYVQYYVIPYNGEMTGPEYRYLDFNLRSQCNIKYSFQITPPLEVLGLQESDNYGNVEACENQIPTVLTNLQGYDVNGEVVNMKNLNYDWWLGHRPGTYGSDDEGVMATIENFYKQKFEKDGATFYLSDVLGIFRDHYVDAISLDNVMPQPAKTVDSKEYAALTQDMIDYLRDLVDKKELVIYSKSLNQAIHPFSEEAPYFFLVACPIHDEIFKQELGGEAAENFEYFCDEPQGVRIEVHDVAPTLQNGFESGVDNLNYDYPLDLGTLSIRLARMGQFQIVQHGEPTSNPNPSKPLLFIPVREAKAAISNATGVENGINHELVVTTPDIYLAETNDPIWAKKINDEMLKTDQNGKPVGMLPVVGKIVSLNAEDTREGRSEEDPAQKNHLSIHFTDNFDVRDGYNYTLKIPFEDKLPDGTLSNACHGDMLINLKIVPDYEVWMGTKDNHDWNNDANWRRADWDDLLLKADGKAPNDDQQYLTNENNGNRNGFAPLYCTHLLIMTPDGTTDRGNYSPELYDMFGNGRTLANGSKVTGVTELENTPFPNLNPETATDILKYDFQAIPYDTKTDKHALQATFGAKENDLIAEMYDINRCQDIVFQTRTELLNAHLLNYQKAWVEFALGKNRWHIVGSPLQDVISGEWYAPSWSTRQESTYFEPIQFGDVIADGAVYDDNGTWTRYDLRYDRFAPAVYQRAWDKAKAVLYEKAANWRTDDGSQTENLGSSENGVWNDERTEWIVNSDEYLERIAYKPMGDGKANVAIKGTWSGTYNDAAVRYNEGGFSIMPMNNEKPAIGDRDGKTGLALFRLPKEDAWYDSYDWGEATQKRDRNAGSRVYIEDNFTNLNRPVTYPNPNYPNPGYPLPKGGYAEEKNDSNTIQLNNRGRLRSDRFAIAATDGIVKGKYLMSIGDTIKYTVTLSNEGNGSTGIFLASNPFICGLDMQKFLAANADNVEPYYLVLNDNEIQGDADLTESHARNWSWHEVDVLGAIDDDVFHGEQIVKPRYAFFLHAKEGKDLNTLTIRYTTDMMARSYGQTEDDTPSEPDPAKPCMTISAQRGGNSSTATVSISPDYSNQFSIGEDMVTLIDEELAADIPVVYTVTGRLATSVNRLNSFTCLPLGVESNSEEYCTLTFTGVDNLSTLRSTSGCSQGENSQLYDAYLETLTPISEGLQVRVPGQTQNRFFIVCGTPSVGVAESNIQIYDEGGTIHVLSTTTAPLTSVRAYDTAGRLVYSDAPNKAEYSFRLPKGVYIIEGLTARDRKTLKQSVY